MNKEGFPIVKEEITLKVFGQQGPVQEEWDTMGMWKKYQEMTNIKLDFTDVLAAEGFDEKKSLMWAGNEYPDIFVRAWLNNTEIVKYGSMGILAPLEDLIPEYAVSYTHLDVYKRQVYRPSCSIIFVNSSSLENSISSVSWCFKR